MKTYTPVAPGARPSFINTKPVFVIDDLDELRGPTTGTVTLPITIDWTPANSYDLAVPQRLRTMYATVLEQASNEIELSIYLNADLLRRHWFELGISDFIRTTWETTHPELRWH